MYPQAYVDFLVYFHGERDYFECHEVLEDYWKEDERGDRKIHWVGLIQIAVSLYHHRRNNFNGAKRMMKSAITILEQEENAISHLGLHHRRLLITLNERFEQMKNNIEYTSLNLPIVDQSLLEHCKKACLQAGCQFGDPSNIDNTALIHKHSLRDRNDVLLEREKQLELKQKRKG
jgi:predicted metal-dependent hydrolase